MEYHYHYKDFYFKLELHIMKPKMTKIWDNVIIFHVKWLISVSVADDCQNHRRENRKPGTQIVQFIEEKTESLALKLYNS